MQYCCWCKKIKNIHTGQWEAGPAEIPQEASGSICPNCEKKIKEDYLKSRQRRDGNNDTGNVKKEIL